MTVQICEYVKNCLGGLVPRSAPDSGVDQLDKLEKQFRVEISNKEQSNPSTDLVRMGSKDDEESVQSADAPVDLLLTERINAKLF
jgi:hypothetical protein